MCMFFFCFFCFFLLQSRFQLNLLHDLAIEISMQTCKMIVNSVKILVTTLYDE